MSEYNSILAVQFSDHEKIYFISSCIASAVQFFIFANNNYQWRHAIC